MKPITYRILLLSLFIIGLSQTSYGNNFEPVNPNIKVHDWDSCMQAYVSATTCGYFGYEQSELPQPDIEGSPLYGNNEDPFWDEEYPDPAPSPESSELGSNPIGAAHAINCRNNAGGLAMSRAQSIFLELHYIKKDFLSSPQRNDVDRWVQFYRELEGAQRVLQARCPGVEAVAPETFDLNYDLPSGDRFIAEEEDEGPIFPERGDSLGPDLGDEDFQFPPRAEEDQLPNPDYIPDPQEEYNMPIPIPQERRQWTAPQWSEA